MGEWSDRIVIGVLCGALAGVAGCGSGASPQSGATRTTPLGSTGSGAIGDATTADAQGDEVESTGGPIESSVEVAGVSGFPSCEGMDVPVTEQTADAVEASTLCLVNKLRRRRAMPALRTDPDLDRAALRHARDMVANDYMSHVSRNGRTLGQRASAVGYTAQASTWQVAENLAWGTRSKSTPHEIVLAWMASPGHRKNILTRSYRDTGLAVVAGVPVSEEARTGGTYVQDFGHRTG